MQSTKKTKNAFPHEVEKKESYRHAVSKNDKV